MTIGTRVQWEASARRLSGTSLVGTHTHSRQSLSVLVGQSVNRRAFYRVLNIGREKLRETLFESKRAKKESVSVSLSRSTNLSGSATLAAPR